MKKPRIIVEMQFGSHVYGTNVPSSDQDFKAIAIPTTRDIVLQRAFKSIVESTSDDNKRNTKDDVDRETFSLHYFLKLLIEGQTVCLDMLFTPRNFHTTPRNPTFYTLINNREKLLSKKMSAFSGYCQAQASKYSLKGSNLFAYETAMDFFSTTREHIKVKDLDINNLLKKITENQHELNGKDKPLAQIIEIPNNKGIPEQYIQIGPKTKIPFNAKAQLAFQIMKQQYDKYGERAKLAQSNQGVDWKALMHAVRVCNEAIELCSTGNITFPRPEKDVLLRIRKGELPYAQVAEMIEGGLIELEKVKAASQLPDKPDILFIEDFIFDEYKFYATDD